MACTAFNQQRCCRKCSQAHPLCIVHKVQALHKLLLGEIALIASDCCPHILQSSLWQAPLHEGSKTITSLHTGRNADVLLQYASHINYAVAAANIRKMTEQQHQLLCCLCVDLAVYSSWCQQVQPVPLSVDPNKQQTEDKHVHTCAAAKRSSSLSSHKAACLDIAIAIIVHLLEHTLVAHSISRLHGWEAAFWLLSLYVALHHGSAHRISCQLQTIVCAPQATCIPWLFRTKQREWYRLATEY